MGSWRLATLNNAPRSADWPRGRGISRGIS